MHIQTHVIAIHYNLFSSGNPTTVQ